MTEWPAELGRALLDEAMDVSCPFWAVKGSGYALEGQFKTGVAAIRRSMKLIHDALTKVLCCWHKNFGGGKRVTHDLWKKDLVALGFPCLDHLLAFCGVKIFWSS